MIQLKNSVLRKILLCCCAAVWGLVSANIRSQEVSDFLKPKIEIDKLARDPQWLALLHYQTENNRDWLSEVDAQDFFLSPTGKTDPRGELAALLKAVSPSAEAANVACRFPARVRWLRERGLPVPHVAEGCREFINWRKQFDTARISLVFASASMDNPSSMFGHTFIRFFNGDSAGEFINSSTLNYYAEADQGLNPAVYFYNGFAGGFWGVIDDQKMFRRLREYSDNQARDLWEFELAFSAEEIAWVADHAWEIKDKAFQYYFIDDNCGYRTLRLLAVAKPELRDMHKGMRSLPSDVVLGLSAQKLVEDVRFIPSAKRQYYAEYHQLTAAEQALVKSISAGGTDPRGADFARRGVQSQVNILSLVMKNMGVRIQRHGLKDSQAYHIFHLALERRLHLHQATNFTAAGGMPESPLAAHKSLRLRLGAGWRDEQERALFEMRFSGHGILDPSAGYPPYAALDFLNIGLAADDEGIELDEAVILHALSITPYTHFYPTHSWLFDFNLERRMFGAEEFRTLNLGGGYGYSAAVKENVLSALATAAVNSSQRSANMMDVEAGVWLAATRQHRKLSYQLSYEYRDYLSRDFGELQQLEARIAWFPARDLAMELDVGRAASAGEVQTQYRLKLSVFK